MTGALAQIITLASYGNCYLKTESLPKSFYLNQTFDFCNAIDFMELEDSKERIIANHPGEWFICLKKAGCKKLRLYFTHSKDQSIAKDHQLAGFVGGGGDWLIEAVYDTYSDYWDNRWEVTDQDEPDRKIWGVNYARTGMKQSTIDLQFDLSATKDKLDKTLTEIAAFAFAQDLTNWGELFENAKALLHDNKLPDTDHLVPTSPFSVTARQLLLAASASWVFGGMGSWNDVGFSSDKEYAKYDKLSEQLHDGINEAIMAAVNIY